MHDSKALWRIAVWTAKFELVNASVGGKWVLMRSGSSHLNPVAPSIDKLIP